MNKRERKPTQWSCGVNNLQADLTMEICSNVKHKSLVISYLFLWKNAKISFQHENGVCKLR